MAISDNYVPLRQLGNGVTTQFSGTWAMLKSSYARVYLENATTGLQTLQTLGVDYTISITSTGFTVIFTNPPSSANYAVIGRETDRSQTTPYKTSSGFQGGVEEDSFDKLTAMVQELKNSASRSLQAPLGDTSSLTLPTSTLRTNTYPYFDASGNLTVINGMSSVGVSSAMAPVVQALSVLSGFNLLAANGGAFGATPTAPNPNGSSSTQLANIGTVSGFVYGFVNKLRNAGMDIAQRGQSGTVSGAYTVDGWQVSYTGVAPTWAQVQNITLPYGGKAINGLKVQGVSGCTDVQVLGKIESQFAASLSGQTVTFQATIVNNTASAITPNFTTRIPTAVDNWGSFTTDLSSVSLQTIPAGTTARVAYTFNAGSTTNLGYMALLDFGTALNNTGNVIITNCDLRVTTGVSTGLNSNPPPPEIRPAALELAFCQRYYEVQLDNVVAMFMACTGAVTNQPMSSFVFYKTTKRVTPTVAFQYINTSVNSFAIGNQSVQGFYMQGSASVGGYFFGYFNYTSTAEL